MGINDFQIAKIQSPFTLSVKNSHASTAIAAGDVVTLDTTNLMTGTQPAIGVNQATTDSIPIGVAVEAIAVGAYGRVMAMGPVIMVVASGAITVGTFVQADASGQVKTAVTDKAGVGLALWTTTTSGDQLPVMLGQGTKLA